MGFWFNGTASVSTITEKQSIKVFPNPAAAGDKINITGVASNSTIQLINTLGQQVYRVENVVSESISIEQSFPIGVYLIKITNNGVVESRKLDIR